MATKIIWFILLALSTEAILVHGHTVNQEGFLSIDCGTPEEYSYTDSTTNLAYTSDAKYISSGTNHNISKRYKSTEFSIDVQHHTLRSFPSGDRNCYTLRPVDKGYKYLVRAFFVYGDYDGRDSAQSDDPIEFDLYIGVTPWNTVQIYNASVAYREEVITMVSTDYIWVCLVNTGHGIPFISSLELRPIKDYMYPYVNASFSLVEFVRLNLAPANEKTVRYPDDPYDRLWEAFETWADWKDVSTDSQVQHLPEPEDIFEVPSAVLRTAVTPANASDPELRFYWSDSDRDERDESMYAMHFAELVQLPPGASRSFNFLLNGEEWYGPFSPSYLLADPIYTTSPGTLLQHNFTLAATNTSTLPPILNAIEVFTVLRFSEPATDEADVDGVNAIKEHFQVMRDWMGDPCVPKAFAWEGLECTYGVSVPPRITTLNLSSSGLNGEIPAFLANLKALKSLDLSNNNLMGNVPDSLADLSSLKLLNLSGNQLTGVPKLLLERAEKGLLTLSVSIADKVDICKGGSCDRERKKSTPIIPIIISIVSAVLLLLVVISVWRIRWRRRQKGSSSTTSVKPYHEDYYSQSSKVEESTIQFESRQFTYIELENITNNFEKVIGKGGFGNVYHGYLPNGAQVAVKIRSLSSLQGTKEFLAEVQLLTRVHHRNLVSFVGYCKDGNYMALIYEYMAQGSLREHLKDKGDNVKTLSWRERLRIALEAAQGLEYLHKGCKPPIVHRDVKTSNILLSEKLEAKIADFGLSRAFHEAATHVSTNVVGTPGYLDPEYYNTYQLNEKSDVYSFGVVLLELITGRPAILIGPEKSHIIQWVQPRFARGSIADIVDTSLRGQYEPNSVWKVADVAMRCMAPASRQRPGMADVLMQLKEAMELGVGYERSQDLYMADIDSSQTLFIDVVGGRMNLAVGGPSAR